VTDDQIVSARAGFWRRTVAYSVDGLIVALVGAVAIGIPVGLLYAASNGAVQIGSTQLNQDEPSGPEDEEGSRFELARLRSIRCVTVNLTQLPEGLDPPPPAKATSASDCRNFAFGLLETARGLTVQRVTEEDGKTESSSEHYTLGADGKPRQALPLDGLIYILFFLYLVVFQRRYGATEGMAATNIRVVDIENPKNVGISLRKAALRNLLIAAPLILLAVMPDSTESWGWFVVLVSAAFLVLAYGLWILVDVVRKKDPIYDRIAGTAVLRRLG